MRTVFYKGELNDDEVSNLILAIEEANKENEDSDITVYLSSAGGYEFAANILLDFVNTREDINFSFTFYDELHSAAFVLALRLKCKKKVLDSAFSILHLFGVNLHTRLDHKTKPFYLKGLNKTNEVILNEFNNFLTEEELNKIKDQEDVYISNERLKMILS